MRNYKWELLNNTKSKNFKIDELADFLLENRGLKTKKEKEEFLNPKNPQSIEIGELGISDKEVSIAVKRIIKAIAEDEDILIYGDYDADGICSSAILWECLYRYTKKVIPYIPDRFSEGYGINVDTVTSLKNNNPKLGLIITVDNGIVAHNAVDAAKKLGIDVIIIDHHLEDEKLPKAVSIIHSTLTSGAGLAWFFAKELNKKLGKSAASSLELAAIGVVADQLPLVGINRSLVKFGIEELQNTKRPGLLALFQTAAFDKEKIGTYEIGYLIAPRINAMGRLSHGIDSLRLICTNNSTKANELAGLLNDTNIERQKVVDEVVTHAIKIQDDSKSKNKIIILAHESYHEGVIGLAASKLVERFYLPSIVISKGEVESKGSARSISGVNIIELIRGADELLIGGGGHTMAAGFSLKTENLEIFTNKLYELAKTHVDDNLLEKKLKIDTELKFENISAELLDILQAFEPFGMGNPTPVFSSSGCEVVEIKLIGADSRHIKLKLKNDGKVIDAIGFGMGELYESILSSKKMQIAYSVEKDTWNGYEKIQLKLKDVKY
ncbi:MAG: Single-stranded-DNA-specific exonuclease RecJ [Microgenomates group bacterium GW2011_GWC1_37_12b]|uniref:Single-stranded-DNA-specific exonuclease RecJ n=1 Tax=Candidatus Woesebacteria bacterium GW2011_GWB1_38_8b TaxID=1618571 RepID=A0A0G0NN06_9BACT|nr:MAG: Single-stranded-DNA-specific exonuclease RecJ [Microgenomates group bacterium GW2011_GWC1_37_12b]KKQ87274.1 MAG: Single-stranded-DNA-specific exonuclease RecJ [Candidatus Woesebacteria bacterium GW2011_GWB1_38_8b]